MGSPPARPTILAIGDGYTSNQSVMALREIIPEETDIVILSPTDQETEYQRRFGGTGIRVCGLSEAPWLESKDRFDDVSSWEAEFADACGDVNRLSLSDH